MKYYLFFIIALLLSNSVFGQTKDTLAAYPCTQKIPITPSFIYCENGKEIKCQNFVARKIRDQIKITASKPENSNSFLPMLRLTFKSDTVVGFHTAENDRINNNAEMEAMGNNRMYSRMQCGFFQIQIESSDEHFISGKFATVLFNTAGNNGQLISGAFKVPFKKEN